VCLECGEDYCSGCFAKIHHKGALRLHRTTLFQAKSQIISNVLDVAHRFIKEVNPDESKRGNNSTKESNKSQHKPKSLLLQGRNSEVGITTKTDECSNPGVGLLCEEPLVEEASAHSPQEAVTQCRAGTQEDSKEQSLHSAKPVFIFFIDSLEECEVQTNLKIWTEPINIEFTEDGLSYMDKLWLKKHRKTLKEQPDMFLHPPATTASTGEVQTSQNENGDESDVEEINVKYPPLFMPVEELDIVRPEPSLTIVQLDDTYEEEYEEKGNIVPYKVELPESQLSITFPNYQKNCFLCESDMCLHRVFNKGRLNLSHLYLRSSPTCYNDGLKVQIVTTLWILILILLTLKK
uniref:B box-type domain-containing protein n=1 Tax=Jaculus jaculus TaxID=51337 RepID=A0A8C5KA95_JACJA